MKHSWNRKENASALVIRPAAFFQKVRWLNEERRTENRREDLEAKQKQTLSSLLKMKILPRSPDRESFLRARRKSLLLRLTSSAQPRRQEENQQGHSNSAQKKKNNNKKSRMYYDNEKLLKKDVETSCYCERCFTLDSVSVDSSCKWQRHHLTEYQPPARHISVDSIYDLLKYLTAFLKSTNLYLISESDEVELWPSTYDWVATDYDG